MAKRVEGVDWRELGLEMLVLRRRRGETQREVAAAVGCHWRTINNLESGRPIGGTLLAAIAKHLGHALAETLPQPTADAA